MFFPFFRPVPFPPDVFIGCDVSHVEVQVICEEVGEGEANNCSVDGQAQECLFLYGSDV